jgi:capsular exopolysaccharide synthesis family protein
MGASAAETIMTVMPSTFPEQVNREKEAYSDTTTSELFDLQRFIAIGKRRWRLFSGVAATALLGAILVTATTTPKYMSVATVLLDPRTERLTNVQDVLSGLPPDSSVVDSEVQVIRSRQVADAVVSALSLQRDPEFNPLLRKRSLVQSVVRAIHGDAAEISPDSSLARQIVIDTVLNDLHVERSGLTYVINIGFQSENPVKSGVVADTFAQAYLNSQVQSKLDATRSAADTIDSRLSQLRQQVIDDEAAVQRYKIANNLMSASGSSLTEQEISSYNQNAAGARAQLAEDEARLRTARAQVGHGSNGEDVGEALNSPVIQGLQQQRADVSKHVAELQGRYGDRHPEMLRAQRELKEIDAQIQAEIQRILSNLEAKVEVSRQRLVAFTANVNQARATLASNNKALVGLAELTRRADSSRTLYETYLARYKETTTQEGIGRPDSKIVSHAELGFKTSPNVLFNLAIGVMLGVGSGLGAVTLAEALSSGLATGEDIERRLGVACLGSIPLLSSVAEAGKGASPERYMVEKPLSSYAEAFRNLLLSVRYARAGMPTQVVGITSSLPSEGKSIASLGVARIAALQGEKVIVVDCDLRRRSLNGALASEPKLGLLEVLAGKVKLEDAIYRDDASPAHFLPLTPGPTAPKNVFGDERFAALLNELRRRYDLVILDTPPVLPIVDTRVLAPLADTMVVLAKWRDTPVQAVDAALKQLAATGCHVNGVALSQVDIADLMLSGYGDPGYYYKEFKKYYLEG